MQEPFYNALAQIFLQAHQHTATIGKRIYLDNQMEMAMAVGDDGVENFNNVPKVDNILSITLLKEKNEDYLSKQRNKFTASTGSACTAEIFQDSHVLKAIPGLEPKNIIRISI